ncbi:NTP transferase domain-containing protein [Pseudooceanicola sp. LIPI14-2-Ac024]|uniref:nucleotidyltransferase family protein n=1 Tax=Pseudooceanicola sp. LIPI14-2-Ac024 TaxID=3344875 RepID=UPI0035D1020B
MAGVAILLLAAGASSRMRGADKLMQELGGRPLVAFQAARAIGTGAPVVVTLPAGPHPRLAALEGLRVQTLAVPDAAEGMAASIRAGVGALPAGVRGVMILPADMPEITGDDMAAMLNAWEAGEILRGAAEDGTPGHPVIFPVDLFEELAGLSGDAGAREVLVRHRARLRLFPLPARHALTDLDTPEAWEHWLAHRM